MKRFGARLFGDSWSEWLQGVQRPSKPVFSGAPSAKGSMSSNSRDTAPGLRLSLSTARTAVRASTSGGRDAESDLAARAGHQQVFWVGSGCIVGDTEVTGPFSWVDEKSPTHSTTLNRVPVESPANRIPWYPKSCLNLIRTEISYDSVSGCLSQPRPSGGGSCCG